MTMRANLENEVHNGVLKMYVVEREKKCIVTLKKPNVANDISNAIEIYLFRNSIINNNNNIIILRNVVRLKQRKPPFL